jgi:hypothetical protein
MQRRGKHTSIKIEELSDAPRLYNEDPRPLEIKLRESLEIALEDD